jgi:NAD(P)-dependent dehydrogenase (short-subunit alcohol dehydrogenase family)
LEISRQLAALGLQIVLTGRDEQAAREAATALTQDDLLADAHHLDLDEPDSIEAAVRHVLSRWGQIDVLVNNAGVAIDGGQEAVSPDFTKVRRTIDTNLLGTWQCCAAVVPHMRARGYGRVVNITSHLGSLAAMGATNVSYRISKAGVNALTKVLAAELEGTGVLVNAASPGRMNTRMAYGETTRTPAEGADTPVWLATLPDDGPTGGLFYERKPLDW